MMVISNDKYLLIQESGWSIFEHPLVFAKLGLDPYILIWNATFLSELGYIRLGLR